MSTNVTRERDNIEEEQPEQGLTYDQYRHLGEEIRIRDINMAAITAKMDALMAQLRITPGERLASGPLGSAVKEASASVNPGTTTSTNPQHESFYDLMAFPPLLQPANLGSMWVPRGISSRATALPYSFQTKNT